MSNIVVTPKILYAYYVVNPLVKEIKQFFLLVVVLIHLIPSSLNNDTVTEGFSDDNEVIKY
jgi:hypothetical protein